MDRTDTQHARRSLLRKTLLKGLLFYILVPVLLLWLLARPIGDAVRQSRGAAGWILPAALGAVGLNWLVYTLIRRKRPSLLVFAHGVLCVLAVLIIAEEAIPKIENLTSTLITIGAFLALTALILLYFWLAARPSKFEHAAAVFIRVLLDMMLLVMIYQIARDFESKNAGADTWISIGFIIALIIGFSIPKIHAAYGRSAALRRKTGEAEGRIVQIVGETRLDRDDDYVTENHARVQYEVNGVEYETRAHISRYTTRKFGRKALVGQKLPVLYDPENPGDAFVKPIDRHFFDNRPLPRPEEDAGEDRAGDTDNEETEGTKEE